MMLPRSPLPPVEPTMIDRMVGYFDPVRGAKRLRARAGIAWLSGHAGGGGYEAGRGSSKALQEYNPLARSATSDIHPGLGRMRARSRDQVRNNPIASGAVGTMVTSTVGSGLTVQPNIDQELLGLSDKQADAWEREASAIWEMWAESTECDIEGECTFGQVQGILFRAMLESGDVLRMRRFLWDLERERPRRGEVFATKLQIVEADRISNPNWNVDTPELQGGVQIDGDGRTLQYWVQSTHPGDMYLWRRIGDWRPIPARDPNTGQRVAKLLLHKQRPGQRRGVPVLAPVILPLKQIDRYTEAEIMAAVTSGLFTVFVTSEEPGDSGPIQGIAGDDSKPQNEGDIHLGNGAVVDLAPGEDVNFANPMRPNAQFDPFVKAVLRQVGMGLEMPYEVLIKHFQASYSASRAALLDAHKLWRNRRKWLVRETCQPCYEDVISEAVARGMIQAPGFFDSFLLRRAWLGTVWTGDAMPQIDPKKEADAAKLRVDLGTSTIDRESRETNGSTFLENHRQRRKEQSMREADNLTGEVVGERIETRQVRPAEDEDAGNDVDDDTEDEANARLLTGSVS